MIIYLGHSEISGFKSLTKSIQHFSRKMSGNKLKKNRFSGNRCLAKIARGVDLKPLPGYYQQTIVKARLVRSNKWQKDSQKRAIIKAHLSYLCREGAKEKKLSFFNMESDNINPELLADKIIYDRHYFRLIVSPENSGAICLKTHGRDLIKSMENDLDTKLEWAGVIHRDTDNPHIHFVLRGKDDTGNDLIIKPRYISNGIRVRSSELVTYDLGPRTLIEQSISLKKSMRQFRALPIDNKIISLSDENNGVFSPSLMKGSSMRERADIRIKFLCENQLALKHECLPNGFYNIDPNLISKLKDMEASHDIYKRLSRFGTTKINEVHSRRKTIIGKVVDIKMSQDLGDEFIIDIESPDGAIWRKRIIGADISKGTIVETNHKYLKKLGNNIDDVINIKGGQVDYNFTLDRYIKKGLSKSGFGGEISDALKIREQNILNNKKAAQQRESMENNLRKLDMELMQIKYGEDNGLKLVYEPDNFKGEVTDLFEIKGVNFVVIKNESNEYTFIQPDRDVRQKIIGQKISVNKTKTYRNNIAKYHVSYVNEIDTEKAHNKLNILNNDNYKEKIKFISKNFQHKSGSNYIKDPNKFIGKVVEINKIDNNLSLATILSTKNDFAVIPINTNHSRRLINKTLSIFKSNLAKNYIQKYQINILDKDLKR